MANFNESDTPTNQYKIEPPRQNLASIIPAQTRKLEDDHRDHLKTSGLNDATIDSSGIFTANPEDLAALGFIPACGRSIVFPYPAFPDGSRIKPDEPLGDAKYLTQKEHPNHFYFTPASLMVLKDKTAPLLITEGEKKALKASQEGYNAIGLAGVYGWLSKGPLADFDLVKWNSRPVTICFDSDVRTNPEVRDALRKLTIHLEGLGASVKVVLLPMGINGTKLGLDDYMVQESPETFMQLYENRQPLFDAALTLLKANMDSAESQEIIKFLCKVSSSYPACTNDHKARIQEQARSVGLTPPDLGYLKKEMRTGSYMIGNATKQSPLALANAFVESDYCKDSQGRKILLFWQDTFYRFDGYLHVALQEGSFRLELASWLQTQTEGVTETLLRDVLLNVKALTRLPDGVQAPCWIGDPSDRRRMLPFHNMLVDLDSYLASDFQCQDLTPDYFSPVAYPYDFHPTATCPLWNAFLDEVLEGDKERKDRLQEWFGYHFDLNMRLEKFCLMIGEGANGKSVALQVLSALIGRENITSISLSQLGERFYVGQLRDKVANIVADLEETDRTMEGILKNITSHELIIGEHKHKSPFTFEAKARLTFSCNDFPRFRDTSNGFRRRILLMPFNWQVPEADRDPQLAQKIIATELSGIFNWALEGLCRLRTNGHFTSSTVANATLDTYMKGCNPVASFVAECCTVSPETTLNKDIIYKQYRTYCESNGYKALGMAKFATELYRITGVEKTRLREGGTRIQAITGLALNTGHLSLSFWGGQGNTDKLTNNIQQI